MQGSNFKLIMLLVIVWGFSACANSPKEEIKMMNKTVNKESTILFVCEHGSAKSVVAAAHFNRLAGEQNLKVRAISRGTNPDAEIPPTIIQGLKKEGLMVGEPKPKLLSKNDVEGASRVITFCQLPADFNQLPPVENWSDVPPISEDYDKSRDAMLLHIHQLLKEVKTNQ